MNNNAAASSALRTDQKPRPRASSAPAVGKRSIIRNACVVGSLLLQTGAAFAGSQATAITAARATPHPIRDTENLIGCPF